MIALIGFIIVCVVGFYGHIRTLPARFSLQVVPDTMFAVPGQRCTFLVKFIEDSYSVQKGYGDIVDLEAGSNSSVQMFHSSHVGSAQVSEVTVIPSESDANSTLAITIYGGRSGIRNITTVRIIVLPGEDSLEEFATIIRHRFVSWLSNNTELGITHQTQWTGTIVRPKILVVSSYLFFSDEWEMGVSWHITIEPHNWARIYLRNRHTQFYPSVAFELSSYTAEDWSIYEVSLSDASAETIWR